MNSAAAVAGFTFDMNATGSLKEFKVTVFANSSLTESVTLEITPAVNTEIDVAEENIGDGMFVLDALNVFVMLKSVLGPYTKDEDISTKVALPTSFQKIVTVLLPVEVNPISMGTMLANDPFKTIAVALVSTTCPETVMEIELAFKTEG